MLRAAVVIVVCLVGLNAGAQSRGSEPLSKDDQKALDQTKTMLRDRNQVDAFTKSNAPAKAVDDNVRSLMGSDTDATYDLAADIFDDLVKEAKGDPNKLAQLIEQAQKNPAAFAARLSPAQREKIRGLANKVEERQKVAPAPH